MCRVISFATVVIWVLFTIAVPAYTAPIIQSDFALIDNRTNDIWGINGLRLTIGVIATDPVYDLTGPNTADPNNPAYPYTTGPFAPPINLGLDSYNPVENGGQFVRFPTISSPSDISKFYGTYDFTVTNSNGDIATSTSHNLDMGTELLTPTGLSFSDFSTTPVFTFNDPNSAPGQNLGRIYRMDIYDSTNTFVFSSAWLVTPSFSVPGGLLEPGVQYFFRANIADFDTTEAGGAHTRVESRSTNFETFTTPVPEPSTMLLLGFGLLSLGVLKRRVKK
jgi:hypothetical protein